MKLFYYKDEDGNFGDDLNPWMWEKLLPGFFDDDPGEWLVGIGTLINHKLPVTGVKHILGSGYGYGDVPRLDDSYIFHCVRGPKTASILNIDPGLAVTDPAILIRTLYSKPAIAPSTRFGFIPHCDSVRLFNWSRLCEDLGFKFINVEWSVDLVLQEMSECEVLICEAMHGAIVADALRIPWIPVQCYNYISTFKWEDWLATVELPYTPLKVESLFDVMDSMSAAQKFKNNIKHVLKNAGLWNSEWSKPKPKSSTQQEYERARQSLLQAKNSTQYLSSDTRCQELTEKCLEVVEKVRLMRS